MLLSPHQSAVLAALEGLIPNGMGERLAALAATVPSHLAIVEVGSYRGKSTAYLASGAKAGLGAHVYALDAWDLPGNTTGRYGYADDKTRKLFHAQLDRAGVASQVTPIRAFSVDAAAKWKLPIGLLYIDASHLYHHVRQDHERWSKYVAPGGILAFDDYRTKNNPGVTKFVDELRAAHPSWRWEFDPERMAAAWTT